MKLTNYQPQVGVNANIQSRVQAPRDLNAYGGNQAGAGAMSEAMGGVAKLALQKAEEQMTADVMAANLEYTKRLNDAMYGEKGLMRKEQEFARGVTGEFEGVERQIRQQVAGEFKLKGRRAHMAYGNMANRDAMQRFELVRKHEFAEDEKHKDTATNNSLHEAAEFAAKNYNDPMVLQESLNKGNALVAARFVNRGEERTKAAQRQWQAKMLSGVYTGALQAEDYDTAEKIAAQYRDYLPSEVLAKGGKVISAFRKENQNFNIVDSLYSKYGSNIQGALAEIAQMGQRETDANALVANARKQLGKAYVLGGDGNDGTDCGKLLCDVMNVSGLQWGSRYVPYMMDEAKNKGVWRSANSGYAPKAGDLAVVEGDNHIAMYTGEGTTIHASTSRGRVVEDKGTPDQVFGKVTGYISVGQPRSAKEISALETAYLTRVSREQAIKNHGIRQMNDAAEAEMFNLNNQGITEPVAYMAVAKKYATADNVKQLTELADFFSKANTKAYKLSDQEKIQLLDMIAAGEVPSKEALSQELKIRGVSAADYKQFMGEFDRFETKEGKYQYDWQGMRRNAFENWGTKDQTLWFHSKRVGENFIQEYRSKNNNQYPSQAEVEEAINAAGVRPKSSIFTSTSGWTFWQRKGLSQADMVALNMYDMKEAVVNGQKKIVFYFHGKPPAYCSPEEADTIVQNYLKGRR